MENYGRYILLSKLAVGGMAEVFLACPRADGAPEQRIVIKRILPQLAADPHFVTMFLNEARIAARLSHPNIVQLFDLGKEGQSYFLAMEFVHGENLGALIGRLNARGQRLPIPLALRIAREVCRGLDYAHARTDEQGRPLQLIHRDVSPQNIMVSFEGAVKILDFGIARAANLTSTTRTGEIKGKYAYIAPEQARGSEIDQRCDIFSLGLVLYELLTGHNPLQRGNELITLRAALECDIEPPSHFAALPTALEAIVLKALARDPARRHASASEFERAIERFLPDPDPEALRRKLAEAMRRLFAGQRARSGGSFLVAREGARRGPRTWHCPEPTLERAPLDDGEDESTITRRPSPPRERRASARPSIPGSLEELLDAGAAAAGAEHVAAIPRRWGNPAPAPFEDDEETTVTREGPAALGALRGLGVPAAFSRPTEGAGVPSAEALPDEVPAPHRQAHLQKSRPGQAPAADRGRARRAAQGTASGGSGRQRTPAAGAAAAFAEVEEETAVDEAAAPRLPVREKSPRWPPALADDADETTTTDAPRQGVPWSRAAPGSPQPGGGRVGDLDLFDEETTASSANRIRSARRAIERQGGRLDLPRPRTLMSAEVELIGEPRLAVPGQGQVSARQAPGPSVQGSLAERLEGGAPAGSYGRPRADPPDGLGHMARLPDLRLRARLMRVAQRLSIAADRCDELRIRFGVPWSALALALLLLLALLALALALFAGG